jgi:hypothetical protein
LQITSRPHFTPPQAPTSPPIAAAAAAAAVYATPKQPASWLKIARSEAASAERSWSSSPSSLPSAGGGRRAAAGRGADGGAETEAEAAGAGALVATAGPAHVFLFDKTLQHADTLHIFAESKLSNMSDFFLL